MPEAQGTYLSFAGLSTELLLKIAPNGAGAKFAKAYKKTYGADPVGSPNLCGLRNSGHLGRYCKVRWNARVTKAIFSGKGITIPAGRSVLGKAVRIDPKTGDTTAKDITIGNSEGQPRGNSETLDRKIVSSI